jgi:AraC-like DNA-binding protein
MLTDAEFFDRIQKNDACPEAMYVLHHFNGANFPLHLHQKTEFLYVRSGVAYLITPTETHFLPARHYVLIPPRLPHRVVFQSHDHVITILSFAEDRDADHPFYGTLGIYPIGPLLDEMLRYTERWSGMLKPECYEAYLFLLNLKLVLPHISQRPLPFSLPTTEDLRLAPVLHYIYEHLGELLGLDTLARQFGFSPRSLSRLFQRCLFISFGQYLKLRRILTAMEQLLQTKQTVSEIAYNVGYHSLSSFSNTFHKLVGQRPSDFASH